MRVVHLSTQHPALDVRIFQKECRTLAAHGFDTHLVVPDPPAEELHGVQLHHIPRPAIAFRPRRIWQRLAVAYRAAARLRADVYHFHDPELIPVGLLLKRAGAKVVYDIHEDTPAEALTLNKDRPVERHLKAGAWRGLEALARRGLDAFVGATPAIAKLFPPARTSLVQNFPLLDEFDPPAAAPPYHHRPRHVLYAGGITAVRGIREMVAAVAALPDSLHARLVLLGPFFDPALQAEIAVQPGWGRTDYHGHVSREVMRDHLAEARVGLVLYHPEPGHLDAYPNKMFEYMAAGLPVVASDFPLWQQIVRDTGCGLVADPRDPAAIARAVGHLLTHPAEAAAMGQRGRQAVTARYHWGAEATKLLALYDRLQGERRSAA